MIAQLTKGRCDHFVSVGGVPAYRGWTDAWLYDPPGLPVPVGEDAALVDDPALDEKGYRIVRTEAAVFAAHPGAAHFRYPYLYGPYQPAPGSGRSCGASSTDGDGSSWRTRDSPSIITASPRTAPPRWCAP